MRGNTFLFVCERVHTCVCEREWKREWERYSTWDRRWGDRRIRMRQKVFFLIFEQNDNFNFNCFYSFLFSSKVFRAIMPQWLSVMRAICPIVLLRKFVTINIIKTFSFSAVPRPFNALKTHTCRLSYMFKCNSLGSNLCFEDSLTDSLIRIADIVVL